MSSKIFPFFELIYLNGSYDDVFWYHFDKTCIWSIFIFNISFSRIILNIAFSIPLPIVFERLVCGRFYVVFHPDIDSFSSCEQMGVFCLPGFRFVSLFIWYLMGFFVCLMFLCIFVYLVLNWFLSKRERVGCGVCKFKCNLDKPEYKNEIKNIALNFLWSLWK